MLVRLWRRECGPCHRSEPQVRAALDALAALGPSAGGPQLRVYWLDADEAGSADVFAFYSSRRLCRGVPALFLYRGSEDLHAPDLSMDGAEPHAIARLLARAAARSGPADLREQGAMCAKVEPDLAMLRAELAPVDAGAAAALCAAEPFLLGVPPPAAPTRPTNATEMVAQAAKAMAPPLPPPFQPLPPTQYNPQQYYAPPQEYYAQPPPQEYYAPPQPQPQEYYAQPQPQPQEYYAQPQPQPQYYAPPSQQQQYYAPPQPQYYAPQPQPPYYAPQPQSQMPQMRAHASAQAPAPFQSRWFSAARGPRR